MEEKESLLTRILNGLKVFFSDDTEELSEEEKKEVEALNSNTKGFRKEVVAEVKPIDINDILEPQPEKSLGREDRE